MKLTEDARTAIEVITSLGGRPLIVGGSVRDHVLGIESKDVDIEVHGMTSYLHLTEALAKRGRVDTVGASFGVIKFGQDVDISFPRRESKTRAGHTGFSITIDPDMTIEQALARRDFTINAIAFDPVMGDFIDPFGGIEDIEKMTLRHVSDAFGDDPLRVLRGAQFAARFSFRMAPETVQVCRSMVDRFHELSIERVWVEWEKILTKGVSIHAAVHVLEETGWIEHFPELAGASTSLPSVIIAGQHLRDLDDRRRAAVLVASMFVSRPDDARRFLKTIDAPIWLIHQAQALAQGVARSVVSQHEARVRVRMIARMLGRRGRLRDWLVAHLVFEWSPLWRVAESEGVLDAPHPPLLTGDDLIARGLTPSPLFGRILRDALSLQDERLWDTKDQAIEWMTKEVGL